MNFKQNPFSLYDFLGYFTPGAIFAYTLLALEPHVAGALGIKLVDGDALQFSSPQLYVPFVLFAYVFGHLLNYLSSVIVEKYSIWSFGYPSKYLLGVRVYGFFEIGKEAGIGLRIAARLLFGIMLLPVALFDFVFCRLLSGKKLVARPLDPVLAKIIKENMNRLLKRKSGVEKLRDHGSPVETDFFRFAYHFVVENCPNHFPKCQNYVAIYGFLRTMTLITATFWWFTAIHIVWIDYSLAYLGMVLGFGALTAIFYLAFIKFYRRFGLEVYMAISTCDAIET